MLPNDTGGGVDHVDLPHRRVRHPPPQSHVEEVIEGPDVGGAQLLQPSRVDLPGEVGAVEGRYRLTHAVVVPVVVGGGGGGGGSGGGRDDRASSSLPPSPSPPEEDATAASDSDGDGGGIHDDAARRRRRRRRRRRGGRLRPLLGIDGHNIVSMGPVTDFPPGALLGRIILLWLGGRIYYGRKGGMYWAMATAWAGRAGGRSSRR